MNFKYLVLGILGVLFLTQCRKDEIAPTSSWITSGTVFSIVSSSPKGINKMKPVVAGDTTASHSQVLKFAAQRNGTNNVPTITTLTGTIFSEVPSYILILFTRGNRPLSEVGGDSTYVASGWNVNTVNYIESYGATLDISAMLTEVRANALSITITFYPDGYYTFINNQNPVNNQMGWYQLSIVDNIPVGIIYQPLHSGIDFKSAPQLPTSSFQSFGIWGIDQNRFFPLLQLDKYTNIFLKMVPVNY